MSKEFLAAVEKRRTFYGIGFWDITKEALRKIVPAEKFAPTEEKINSFDAGCGTVLFFEETNITKKLQDDFPAYTVKDEWKLPLSWRIIAQMPFGNPISKPNEKGFVPIESRVKVYK